MYAYIHRGAKRGAKGTQPWAPGFRGPLQISIGNYLSVMYVAISTTNSSLQYISYRQIID